MRRYRESIRIVTFVFVVLLLAGFWSFYRSRNPVSEIRTLARYRFLTTTTNDMPKEISTLEAKVAVRPTDPMDLNELAARYVREAQRTGDTDWYAKAEAVAQRSLKALASPNPAKMILAQVAESNHRFDDAIQWAERAMKDRPSVGALQVIATSYLAKGDFTKANQYADQLVDRRPGPDTLLTRGLVRAAQGRNREAVFDFRRAVQLEDFGDPLGAARLRTLWARTLIGTREYTAAGALLEEALRIVPQYHLALAIRGELEMAEGQYGRAADSLMQAFSNSKQVHYLVLYARAKSKLGERAAAEEMWDRSEKIVRANLTESEFGHRLDLVQILVDRGRPEDLKAAVPLAREELAIRRNSETLFYLAKAYVLQKDWPRARDAMSELLGRGLERPEHYALAAEIQRALGYLPHAEFYTQLAQP
jgi:tetratricopeptide (TPR) repeat protein